MSVVVESGATFDRLGRLDESDRTNRMDSWPHSPEQIGDLIDVSPDGCSGF